MKNNKGFSLVELIIVIAIMAILVGVMAPQLLKYIEKSKITSDLSMLNALEVAFAYGVSDPEINNDPNSMALIDYLINNGFDNAALTLDEIDADSTYNSSKLYAAALDTLGWNQLTDYKSAIKSTHGAGATIYISYYNDINNPVKIWITETDINGEKVTTYTTPKINDPNFVKCIHID